MAIGGEVSDPLETESTVVKTLVAFALMFSQGECETEDRSKSESPLS